MTSIVQPKAGVSIGIDVSKHHLDVHVHPLDQSWRVDNSAEGLSALQQHLHPLRIARIAVESTGGRDTRTSRPTPRGS